ncbi:MAG: hypothetical protein JXA54_03560 [Candidatus Heimdallarchaeota archaeon]|nr:hypothetical protein [Candidatus Heimdallarchaeota archaeon]
MSSEEKLAKQLDGIASSIIKALEGLEKELSEYIEITNRRLHILENKMQNLESLADVSGKGLVKVFESLKPEENSIFPQDETPQPIIPPSQKPIIPVSTEPKIINASPITTIPKIESELLQSEPITPDTKIPPVHTQPTFQSKIEDLSQETTPQTTAIEAPITPDTKSDDQTKKKDSEDKDELMSALKIIDSL